MEIDKALQKKVKRLLRILTVRLNYLSRWSKVYVFAPWDKLPPEILSVHGGEDHSKYVYIFWNGRKSATNHHDYEFKQVPIENISAETAKHRRRHRDEVMELYK